MVEGGRDARPARPLLSPYNTVMELKLAMVALWEQRGSALAGWARLVRVRAMLDGR